jgi:hypothetical protein
VPLSVKVTLVFVARGAEMPKKSKVWSFDYEDSHLILFQNEPTNRSGMAKWNYRITIKGYAKTLERKVSDYFEYKPKHYARAEEEFPFNAGDPPTHIQEMGKRILYGFREQLSRTGEIILDHPKLSAIIDAYVVGDDLDLMRKRININKSMPEALFIRLNHLTYDSLKRWTEQFGDHEYQVRAALKKALIKAKEEEVIGAYGHLL